MANDGLTWLTGRQQLSAALTDEASAAQVLDPQGGDSPLGWTNRIALLLVDVDRFTDLESRLGPAAAEEVLAQIARRMRSALRSNQVLARLGGDEFAVVLPDADKEVARRVAQALLSLLDDTFQIGSESVQVSRERGNRHLPTAPRRPERSGRPRRAGRGAGQAVRRRDQPLRG